MNSLFFVKCVKRFDNKYWNCIDPINIGLINRFYDGVNSEETMNRSRVIKSTSVIDQFILDVAAKKVGCEDLPNFPETYSQMTVSLYNSYDKYDKNTILRNGNNKVEVDNYLLTSNYILFTKIKDYQSFISDNDGNMKQLIGCFRQNHVTNNGYDDYVYGHRYVLNNAFKYKNKVSLVGLDKNKIQQELIQSEKFIILDNISRSFDNYIMSKYPNGMDQQAIKDVYKKISKLNFNAIVLASIALHYSNLDENVDNTNKAWDVLLNSGEFSLSDFPYSMWTEDKIEKMTKQTIMNIPYVNISFKNINTEIIAFQGIRNIKLFCETLNDLVIKLIIPVGNDSEIILCDSIRGENTTVWRHSIFVDNSIKGINAIKCQMDISFRAYKLAERIDQLLITMLSNYDDMTENSTLRSDIIELYPQLMCVDYLANVTNKYNFIFNWIADSAIPTNAVTIYKQLLDIPNWKLTENNLMFAFMQVMEPEVLKLKTQDVYQDIMKQ